ncbi:MAG: phasin family protein [Novosphingobium sp.]
MTTETIDIIPSTELQVVPATSEPKRTLKSVFADLQERAKAARAKVAPLADQISGMHKGNVEVISTSRKTLGAGLKEIGQDSVAEGRQAIQTVVADVKEMAALRSPKEIVQLQRTLAKRNFASIKGFAAKTGTALRALAGEALTPLGERLQANLATVRNKAA